jgi:hypothetical protein
MNILSHDDNNISKCFRRDENLDEKIKKFKFGFLNIILKKAHYFIKNGLEFNIPECVKERSKEYIKSSYVYLDYLNNFTQKSQDDKCYISISELYEKIKISDIYLNSTKIEKRKITLKSLIDFFSKNDTTKKSYREIYRPYINGKQIYLSNILFEYKFVDNNNDNNN